MIASGGAGKPDDFTTAITQGHASAVLAASVFHFGQMTIDEAKSAMQQAGVAVRRLASQMIGVDNMSPKADILDHLFADIVVKATEDPTKVIQRAYWLMRAEEVTEALIEVMRGDKQALAKESADILYHLLVVWQAAGITPDEVWRDSQRQARHIRSGRKSKPYIILKGTVPCLMIHPIFLQNHRW